MRLIGDMIEFCAEKVPSWYPVSISGYHMREAGCTATQEIAFTLANAIAYIQTCLDKGLKLMTLHHVCPFSFVVQLSSLKKLQNLELQEKYMQKS